MAASSTPTRRAAGAAAPSRRTCYRYGARNWLDGLQFDPGSGEVWRVDSRCLRWYRSPVLATTSLAAHAQSYQVQVRAQGYAMRGGSAATDVDRRHAVQPQPLVATVGTVVVTPLTAVRPPK